MINSWSRKILDQEKFSDNDGQNICRLFHVLVQFFFTKSTSELDYNHQKVNVQDASTVAIQLKPYEIRKLENFKKTAENL